MVFRSICGFSRWFVLFRKTSNISYSPQMLNLLPMDSAKELKKTMHIETSRLILRLFTEADAKVASYNSKILTIAHFMSDMVLETESDAVKWIHWLEAKCNDREPCRVLAIELKDDYAVIGLVSVAPKRELGGELEILFSIADEHQNKGYATEAAKAIIWWAFEKAGQDVLSAIVKPENRASRRVIEKLGFVYVDTLTLSYDGEDCAFDYFRFYHTDYFPGPVWELQSLYKPEPMDAFFDVRAEGYNDHMLSGGGEEDYKKLGGFIPKTDKAIKILDIGCGTGIELDYILAQTPNAHVTCVDMSQGMLDLLLRNHPESHNRITVIVASYLNWEYPQDTFDLVVSSATMHHLWPEDKVKVYRKILSTLKPGGAYIESDFIVDTAHSEQYRRRYEIITAGLPEKAKAGEYHIDIPLTVDVQKELLEKAGFRIVEVLDENINRGNGAILRAASKAQW